MKKIISFIFLSCFITCIYAQTQQNKALFLKGNITDKTNAVRQASGEEAKWITDQAINFVLENKDFFGNDRDIESLALAAILSISNDYTETLNSQQKTELLNNYLQLFNKFESSSTVQIAVLSKISMLDKNCDLAPALEMLNNFVSVKEPSSTDSGVYKAVINALGQLGNNVSFTILYNALNDYKYNSLFGDIEKAVVQLIPVSMNEVLQITHSKDLIQMSKILNLNCWPSRIAI